ncbi:TetR family transcriptional regulator C-terminal domain-containing protein [Ensifer sp. ENS06]|uniref:TetR family transcriptional regulator C-terminal domain-containing protein n=1 Tax=Ensifer sp. ENS06 TaxID=2769276 RepID=UPI000DDDC3C7|nr:TetR family transcriptional regulator C-terminal domain-containing protein [Ensifer sp. ENS06]MBD9624710.1 TetR family transcriptional regulator C-terminal domain-containing protein [Ensifer sp. ENS06]
MNDDAPKIRTRKSLEMRQQEVIDAALRAIGRNGLSRTTLADIAKEAGIGYGNLSFRFKKKEALLVAALQYLIDEYEVKIDGAAATGSTAVERLDNVLELSFSRPLTTKNKLAVWAAFWSECHTQAAYRKLFGQFRIREAERMTSLCRQVLAENGGASEDAEAIAVGINALIEGLWSSMARGGFLEREEGLAIARKFASRVVF